ncbi:hypothetical protein Vadar_012227 [Vaccinium darrowii]|uniref:Uncharacterized protein n=1 Tax=Vaccinium darrowii TaxID=229202 RepID=A0ACB7X9U8_9ERIC|nr:hypothetical protein Vadar_012227 [Vaccinium darrowii]
MINWEDGKIHKDLTDLDRPKWSLAYDGGRRYGSCTTNVSEGLNGVLKEARHLPITATVMTTFYKSVEYFFSKVEGARQRIDNNHALSNFAMAKFDHWMNKARRHRVMEFNRELGVSEVETPMHPTSPGKGNHKHTIELVDRKCTCGKFQQWKMPCSHVIALGKYEEVIQLCEQTLVFAEKNVATTADDNYSALDLLEKRELLWSSEDRSYWISMIYSLLVQRRMFNMRH